MKSNTLSKYFDWIFWISFFYRLMQVVFFSELTISEHVITLEA